MTETVTYRTARGGVHTDVLTTLIEVLTPMRNRRGFTLVELLVALVIMLHRERRASTSCSNTSQRLSRAQAERVDLQSNVRSGALVVPDRAARAQHGRRLAR